MRLTGFVLLFLTLCSQALHADTVLRFCYDPYPPYTLQEDGQLRGGVKVNVLQEVVALIDGVDAEVTLMPWQRCQDAVRAGELDGILPLFPNATRGEYMAFSDPVFGEQSAFFFSTVQFPDGLTWSGNAQDLSHLRLGMLRGGFIDEEMEASFDARGNIQRGSSVEALMLMLINGRVDLVGTDVNVGRHVAAREGISDRVSWVARPIVEKTSHFGLSTITKADVHLPAFNAALEVLRNSGRLQELLSELQ